ncbi:MAG TPA: helix-turn-helix domain-containing protein [Nitrososphaera sp.]|jgi:DNA-binding HxlR family transcriptional regulator|nr:helix-turn-helix domain-containing protein [Nitrososphaera sp.]
MNPAQPFASDVTLAPPEALKRCPIDNTFRIIGKKFTVLILRNMIYSRQKHFNEFLNSIDGINPNTLSTRLREMEKNNIINRTIYHETPVRIEYSLTEKGKELLPILDQMAAFSMKHAPEIFRNNKTSSFQKITGRDPVTF